MLLDVKNMDYTAVNHFVRELGGNCQVFGLDPASILDAPFTVATPDSTNPYKQMYAAN